MKQGSKALVVDDSPSIREYIRAILLEELNFTQVQLACCADEGMDLLQSDSGKDIGWVICDWEMPGRPASELFEYVRQNYQADNIRLVLITGRKDNLARQLANELGADAFLSKPFTAGLLVSKIRGLMGVDERRRSERIGAYVPCELDIGFDGFERLQAELVNISATGCLVKMPPLRNGYGHVYDIGSITFTFEDASQLELDGHIVRIEHDSSSAEDEHRILIAFEYLYMETAKKQALQTYLQQCFSFVENTGSIAC